MKRQYLLVESKKCRRHSAPEPLNQGLPNRASQDIINCATKLLHEKRSSESTGLKQWFSPQEKIQNLLKSEGWCRKSVSDFSVLLENQSDSNSSQELDTSSLSRELSPVPTRRTTPRDSYQNLPAIDFGTIGKANQDEHWHGFGSCFPGSPQLTFPEWWLIRKIYKMANKDSKCNIHSYHAAIHVKFMWKNIILSQTIAGCMAIMDVSNAGLKNSSSKLLTNGQNFLHYILLSVLWTTKLALRNDGRDLIQVIRYSGLRYFFLSVLHVEANYLLLSSFHHNSYLGNQVIDCVAAYLCLMIAYVSLEVRFHLIHISGFALTTIGATGLFIANTIHRNQNEEDVLLGVILRIASGICLALNSTAQEIIVKSIDFVEYLGMIGLIGSLICGFQAMILETNKIVLQTSAYGLSMMSYSVAQFLLNSLTPRVLHEMGAPGLHLALTSSEFYSYFIKIMYQWEKMHIVYLISYAVTLTGSILFFTKRTVIGTETFFPVKITIIKES